MSDEDAAIDEIVRAMRRLANVGHTRDDGAMLTGLANAYTALVSARDKGKPSIGSELAASLREAREKAKATEASARVTD